MVMTERPRDQAASNLGSAKNILFELQVEQLHHDENYHREIARLSMHQRLNHMALHFSKYAGKIAGADRIEDSLPVFVDTLIIALSTANILNVEVWDLLDHESREYPGLLAFGRSFAICVSGAIEDRNKALQEMSIAAGIVAAACEKIDHLEEIPFRSEIKRGLSRLMMLSLGILASNGIEPAAAVRERLASVKSRLKLHGRI